MLSIRGHGCTRSLEPLVSQPEGIEASPYDDSLEPLVSQPEGIEATPSRTLGDIQLNYIIRSLVIDLTQGKELLVTQHGGQFAT